VILHLEPRTKGGKPLRHTIPYIFEETADYSFCVPDDDPYIRSLTLVREGSHRVVVQVPRGAPCKTRTIAAGLYQLHVEHDGTDIPAEGKMAFVHIPRKGNLQAGGGLSSFPSACDSNTVNNPLFTFTAPDGLFVNPNPYTTPNFVQTVASSTDPSLESLGWNICADTNGYVTFTNSYATGLRYSWYSDGPSSSDTHFYVWDSYHAHGTLQLFKITDLGNGQFTLAANFLGTFYPIIYGTDHALHWASPGTTPAVFTITLKWYQPSAVTPSLQQDEIAVFEECSFSTNGGTFVFTRDIPDFFPYFESGFNQPPSLELGPQTNALLYPNANYDGLAQVISEDIPCLNPPPGPNSSLKIIPPIQEFIVASNGCQYCNLTGIDLSGLDLTAGDFTATLFNQANLTNTIFQSATLDQTHFRSYASEGGPTLLSGADFLGALLHCTDFQASDLREAFFWSNGTPPVLPVITKDFSCRLQLQYAHLNLDTFPVNGWRYFLLGGAAIVDASGQTLSTTSQPLDLSYAQLNATTGLTYVDLTGANIAGANFTGTDLTGAKLQAVTSVDPDTNTNVPAVFNNAKLSSANLQNANLIGALLNGAQLDNATLDGATLDGAQGDSASFFEASLKRATLAHALLQGADLISTNLDGANLCAANLGESPTTQLSAALQGAFLRNVNLAQADLTGASLDNANFYSTATASTCNSAAACGFLMSCASAVNAQLKNTGFTGAYLAGVDFTGSAPQSANFRGTYLVGSNFTNANLTQDTPTGLRTDFTEAWLQGTTFTNATVTGANFTNAVVDLTHSQGATLTVQLSNDHLTFPNYTPSGTPGCVEFTYNSETEVPITTNSNVCPDGNFGPCTTMQWEAISPPTPPMCTVDFNWIFVSY
jgi:uncharacterized protein YjbI with pentapeptide repeats